MPRKQKHPKKCPELDSAEKIKKAGAQLLREGLNGVRKPYQTYQLGLAVLNLARTWAILDGNLHPDQNLIEQVRKEKARAQKTAIRERAKRNECEGKLRSTERKP